MLFSHRLTFSPCFMQPCLHWEEFGALVLFTREWFYLYTDNKLWITVRKTRYETFNLLDWKWVWHQYTQKIVHGCSLNLGLSKLQMCTNIQMYKKNVMIVNLISIIHKMIRATDKRNKWKNKRLMFFLLLIQKSLNSWKNFRVWG